VVSYHLVGPWWLTPVTPATQQAETRRMAVWSQSRQKRSWDPLSK
jgi:hypothetical protein